MLPDDKGTCILQTTSLTPTRMNTSTLKKAVQLGQLITLLTPLAHSSNSFDKRLSRLRSGAQEQVLVAALASQDQIQLDCAVRLSRVLDALKTSVKDYVEVPLLLARWTDPHAKPLHGVQMLTRDPERRKKILRQGLEVILENASAFPLLRPTPGFNVAQEARTQVAKAYASAVRNADWLDLLLQLGLSETAAQASNRLLLEAHSSHPGRMRLPDNLRTLCADYAAPLEAGHVEGAPKGEPSASPPQLSAEGLYTLHVSLDWSKLQAHPVIAALAIRAHGAEPEGYDLDGLGARRVPPGTSPGKQAQEMLDALVADLQLRKALIEQAQAKQQAQQADAARAQALEALKQLDPAVLQALQANPGLLQAI